MARHRHREPPRIEPPGWYRHFDPGAWDEPDTHERYMMDGCAGLPAPWPGVPGSAWPGWPQHLHEQHARRRWAEAKYAYSRQHPQLAEQEFNEIRARRAVRRGSGGDAA